MKNLILGMFLVISSLSSATSLRDTRLSLEVRPLHPTMGSKITYVQVYGNGEVVGITCPAKTLPHIRLACKTERIEYMSRFEMRQMDQLIKQAKFGHIVYPNPHGVSCLAIPSHGFRYTANNNQIFLSSGSRPCGSITYNGSQAAAQLRNMLDKYHADFGRIAAAE